MKINKRQAGAAATFLKEGLLQSARYAHRQDLLGVLLEADRQYTFEEVDMLLDEFMKGKVK